ncbi:MAG: DUF2089 domain-containing protein [Planctomycetes bacterium]|nr:DUF2089 domain-containing protein [Planctomycetota bacterium]
MKTVIDKTKTSLFLFNMASDSFKRASIEEAADHPLLSLQREDLDLVVQLVLASGSLTDLAATYEVSYPTIRARLDRTIARLREVLAGRTPDPVIELVADLVERGELSTAGARAIRDLVRGQGSRPGGTHRRDT